MKFVATVAALCMSGISLYAQAVDKPKFLGGPGSQRTTLAPRQQATAVGTKVAAFSAITIDQQKISNEALRGKPAIFIVCTTHSSACRAELPDVHRKIVRVYPDKLNVVMIAPGEDEAALRGFNARMTLPFHIIADPHEKLVALFPGNNIPRTYVVDAAGTIIHQESGYMPHQFTPIHKSVRVALKLDDPSQKSTFKIGN